MSYAPAMEDDAPIEVLKHAVENLHQCSATFVEAVDVREEQEGKMSGGGL